MKKYIFSMICTLLPIFASAQEPYAIMIDGNTAIEFRYDNNRASYPDAMDIGPFNNWEERPWNSLSTSIISVIFDESFANCTSITSTAWWFASMQYLDYIGGLEYLNTSNVTDMSSMFLECQKLEEIDVSHFNTSNVTSMFQMFTGCQNVKSLDVTHFNTENVKDMRWMFGRCSSLTNLDLSSFNTANVTIMGEMFNGDENLTSLDISTFNTSNVTIMWLMFGSCTSLKTIYVGDGWSTASVTDSSNMFEGCTSLVGGAGTTYDSSHTDASYAHVDGGFSNPGYLTFGSSGGEEAQYWMELMSTLQYADDVYARADGNSNVEPWMLEELSEFMNRGSDMYDEHTADEEEVRQMIEEINWICWEIEETMNRQPSGEAEPYAVLSDNNTVLTFYYDDQKSARGGMDVGPFDSRVIQWDGNDAYTTVWGGDSRNIIRAVFDASFANCTTITNSSYWFESCSHMTEIIGLNYFNTSNVTDMSNMFEGCHDLTTLDLSSFNTTNVTTMFAMFRNCFVLKSLNLSSFNTSNVTDMSDMFDLCTSLTSLDVSSFNTSKVTFMGNMFGRCSSLTTIYVGSGWSTANVSSSDYMFGGCERLVGGRGTTYDSDHVDAAYAHIDGGTNNPGYLTDINGSGTSDLEQRRAELLDMISQLMQLADVCAYELERKDPQRSSELWNDLAYITASIYDVRDRTERAESDAELDECEERIRQIWTELDWLQMRIDEYEAVDGETRFDGLTAWVYGDKTLDDAFAEVGREAAVQTIAAIVWEGNGELTSEQMQGITNPNLLVYVNEASKAPAGVQNIIVNGTAAQIVLTDASGNNNFHCPQTFTAQSIYYTRNFSQTTEIGVSRGWETIALPFNVQSIVHESHGALVPFGGGNSGYPIWLHQLRDNGLTPVTAIEANTPYLICMPNNRVYPSAYNQAGNVTFASSNVTVPETNPHEAFGGGVMLVPAFQGMDSNSDIFTLNVGEASGSYAEGSVFISNYRSVRPFQAYARHTSQARGEDDDRYIPLTSIGGGGDDTTGIMEMIQPADNGTGDWYSLDGRKLSSKPTKKGVYIQNGKKIVIK